MNQEGLFTDLTDNIIASNFSDFMTRYAMLEELVNVGERFLRGFCREVEVIKRTPLSKASCVVDDVIKANYTDRLKVYIDTGHCNGAQSISNLDFCKHGLEDHLLKAKVLLVELENLKKNATVNAHLSMDKYIEYFEDAKGKQSYLVQEDTQEILPPDESINRSFLMIIIYDMLKLDFIIQEKIIGALFLDTPSSELESYCVMWALRPYVNDAIIHHAWKLVKAPAKLDSELDI